MSGVAQVKASKRRQWTELYRPTKVSQMIGNNTLRENLVKDVVDGVSHVLMCGPPGCGKTTSALAIARQLFPHPSDFKSRVLELNASTDRGVAVVRDTVADFARRAISKFQKTADPTKNDFLPPIRIIILDEADRMTHDAQAVLRQMTEKYGEHGVRFFILCNYPSDIIVPITSRCLKVYFDPPPIPQIAKRLHAMARVEQLLQLLPADSKPIFNHIALRSGGDMRNAIHTLQSLAQECRARDDCVFELNTVEQFIHRVDAITGFVPDAIIDNLIEILLAVPRLGAKTPDQQRWCETARYTVIDRGYSVGRCLEQLSERLLERSRDNENTAILCANYMYRISQMDVCLHGGGGDPMLCLFAVYHSAC